MSAFVSSGLIADVALALLVVEAILIGWLRRPGERLRAVMDVAPFLAAGAGLLIALRAALVGWPSEVVLAALSFAGAAQAVDLARRLRG